MSLHSHWAQIKRQKGVNDVKRGQIFTKLGREITLAAREGGTTPPFTPRLRLAIQKAKDSAMPSEIIERALKKVAAGGEAGVLEEVWYEGYGPGGAAILVIALTDNRNRTSNEVRAVFSHQGGNLGSAGGVAWLFDRKGLVLVEGTPGDLEGLALAAIDAGAEDFNTLESVLEVYTPPERLEAVREALSSLGARITGAEITLRAKSTVDLDDRTAGQNLRLLEKLDDLEDVQQVYTNANIPEAVLQAAR